MKPTVLIVDDDSNVRCALLRLLRKESYEILAANSAEDAKHFVQRHRVDLIVTDNQMAGMCGLEFLRWVREVDPGIVRIMLTGNTNLDTTVQAKVESTIHHYFSKPCDVALLAATIREEFAKRKRTCAGTAP